MEKVTTERNKREEKLDCQLTNNEHEVSQSSLQSIKAVLSKPADIYKLFFLFTKKLNKILSIAQSSLILHSIKDNSLKVIAMKGEKGARKGLTLTLPEKDSLLYRIFYAGDQYFQNSPNSFDGNFIEKKILGDVETGSLVILPINQNDTKFGLVCLSSPNQNAFSAIENGTFDEILEDFNKYLIKNLPSAKI